MAHRPEHKGVVDALIDHELDVQQLVDDVVKKSAPSAAKQLLAATVRIFELRAKGKVSVQQAKQLLRDARKAILLAQFSRHVHEVKKTTDAAVDRQLSELRKLGVPARELSAINNADKLARAAERKRAKEEQDG